MTQETIRGSGASPSSTPGMGVENPGNETIYLVDPAAAHLISGQLAKELRAVPVAQQGSLLTVAMAQPEDQAAVERLTQITGLQIKPVAADAEDLRRAQRTIYRLDWLRQALKHFPLTPVQAILLAAFL